LRSELQGDPKSMKRQMMTKIVLKCIKDFQ